MEAMASGASVVILLVLVACLTMLVVCLTITVLRSTFGGES